MAQVERIERFTPKLILRLERATKPYKRSEAAERGEGRLIVRRAPSGPTAFFYRYRSAGEDTTLLVGKLGEDRSEAGIRSALKAVRAKCAEIRELRAKHGNVKSHLQSERAKGTFGDLLAAYVSYLRADGKPSAKQAEGIFKRHVLIPQFAAITTKRANEVEPGDVQLILARMVNKGIKRQVNAARSYLRAAFSYGGKQDHDPRTVAKAGVVFTLKGNPVDVVPRIAAYEVAGDHTLTDQELREYWKGLEALPPIQRATLRLNLALCQQRPTQLLRAGWADFDLEQQTLLLRDSKGRGATRDHLLPLTAFAVEQLKTLRQFNEAAGSSPFSSDGKRPMAVETLSHAVADVSDKLSKSRKAKPFDQRDLRRTAETSLQKLGVDREVRAHLLSHGRSQGVQGKHYERHDFLREKRQALNKWAAHLERIIEGKSEQKILRLRSA